MQSKSNPAHAMSAEVVSQLTDDLSTLKVSPQESKTKVKAVQPDISYHPNLESWKARTARRLAENPDLPKTPLPAGFPKKLDSPLVWDATVYTDPSQWEYELSPEHLKEIDDALKFFQGAHSTSEESSITNMVLRE